MKQEHFLIFKDENIRRLKFTQNMLEIIGIILLARYIGKVVREKGRNTGWYQFLAV